MSPACQVLYGESNRPQPGTKGFRNQEARKLFSMFGGPFGAFLDFMDAAEEGDEVGIAIGVASATPMGKLGGGLAKVAKGARVTTGPVYKTTKEAKQAAEALGFKKINETVHGGQAVFQRGKDFITRDLDGHNGGAWKMADSVKALGSKETRAGTFDVNLNRIGD